MGRSGEVSRRTVLGAAAAALVGCATTSADVDAAPEVTGAKAPLEAAPTVTTPSPTSSAAVSPVTTEVPLTDTASPSTSPPARPTTTADGLPLRPLGRIDWLASAITMGGAGLRDSKVVSYALERGVNVLDTAPSYGTNHETIKPVLADHRDDVFLLSKVREREGRQIDQALRSSLNRMGVDTIDIVLLHDIDGPAALDRATARSGALGALEAARNAGVIRHIGLSGHVRSDVLVTAFDRFDFDLVLCPVNPMDAVIDDFVTTAAAVANGRGAAVMGMKVMAAGRVTDPARALRWALSQPTHTLTLGMMSNAEVDLDIDTAIEWHRNPPSGDELDSLVQEWRSLAIRANFYWRS